MTVLKSLGTGKPDFSSSSEGGTLRLWRWRGAVAEMQRQDPHRCNPRCRDGCRRCAFLDGEVVSLCLPPVALSVGSADVRRWEEKR